MLHMIILLLWGVREMEIDYVDVQKESFDKGRLNFIGRSQNYTKVYTTT